MFFNINYKLELKKRTKIKYIVSACIYVIIGEGKIIVHLYV